MERYRDWRRFRSLVLEALRSRPAHQRKPLDHGSVMADLWPITTLRAGSRVCAAPSALGSAFPHGGTDLGEAARIEFAPGQQRRAIEAEEDGGEVIDWIVTHERPFLLVLFRGATTALYSKIYAAPGSGRLASARSFPLLVSPVDPATHAGLYIPAAVPLWDETARLRWMISEEIGVPAAFGALRSGGRLYTIDLLGSITT